MTGTRLGQVPGVDAAAEQPVSLALARVNYYHSASTAGTPHEPAPWCRESNDQFQTQTLRVVGRVSAAIGGRLDIHDRSGRRRRPRCPAEWRWDVALSFTSARRTTWSRSLRRCRPAG
jgi:hypothetical protein